MAWEKEGDAEKRRPWSASLNGQQKMEQYEDPFKFRESVKNKEQLAELRRRPSGKKLEKYHRRQNDVRVGLNPCFT